MTSATSKYRLPRSPVYLLTIDNDAVVVKYDDGPRDGMRAVSSLDELTAFLTSQARKHGVDIEQLKLVCAAALDFPEDCTDNATTITLARELRQ